MTNYMKPRDCIYCGARTGSKEHGFPAALGGRRVNKGIFCGPCNEGFSPIDAELSAQLEGINGLLGVVRDHGKRPHRAGATDANTGREYRIDAEGRAHLAGPVVSETKLPDGTTQVEVLVSDESQFRAWLAEQRANGVVPKHLAREEWQSYSPGFEFRWSFGGESAFREIGRIALNFLAHHFPVLARRRELRPIKAFVLGQSSDRIFVAYSSDEAGDLPPNEYEFGHRILLGMDANTGDLYARVEFFSTFCLAVHLGVVEIERSATIITDIDPLALHPPDDIHVRTFERALAEVRPIPGPTENAHVAMRDRLPGLIDKLNQRRWDLTSGPLLRELNELGPLGRCERQLAVKDVLTEHRQRVIALAASTVRGVQHAVRSQPEFDPAGLDAEFLSWLDGIVQADPESRTGVTTLTRAFAHLLEGVLASRIAAQLDASEISSDELRELLDGPVGTKLAVQIINQIRRSEWP